MKPVAVDLDTRRPVWRALSDLYLDNSYRDFVRAAARALAPSLYTLDELREILWLEVHPVLVWNLWAPIGVWDGFDLDWLAGCILRSEYKRRGRKPRPACGRRYAQLLWRLLESRFDFHHRH
jgi:hypothetical protein